VKSLGLFARGICMGIADIIPGVSGGTMAYITGIYDDLLASIRTIDGRALRDLCLLRWRAVADRVAWRFLVPLVVGIAMAFLAAAPLVTYLLNHPVYHADLFGLFLGLILISAWLCARQAGRWQAVHYVAALAAAIMAWFLSGPMLGQSTLLFDLYVPHMQLPLQSNTTSGGWLLGVDNATVATLLQRGDLTPTTLAYNSALHSYGAIGEWVTSVQPWRIDPWLIGCGCSAAIAMLLPGISGSYLLTILGLYGPAMAALSHLLNGSPNVWEPLTLLTNLAVGILAGLAIGARAIRWLLQRYRGWTLAALTGFMLGALRSIWPFWTTAVAIDPLNPSHTVLRLISPTSPAWSSMTSWSVLLCAIAGGFLVWAIEVVARRRTPRTA